MKFTADTSRVVHETELETERLSRLLGAASYGSSTFVLAVTFCFSCGKVSIDFATSGLGYVGVRWCTLMYDARGAAGVPCRRGGSSSGVLQTGLPIPAGKLVGLGAAAPPTPLPEAGGRALSQQNRSLKAFRCSPRCRAARSLCRGLS